MLHFDQPLALECGTTLPAYDLIYETYGTLNEERNNAVLICHALSGNHHAAGYHSMEDRKPGWWDSAIGPDKAIDTNRFFRRQPQQFGGMQWLNWPHNHQPRERRTLRPRLPYHNG